MYIYIIYIYYKVGFKTTILGVYGRYIGRNQSFENPPAQSSLKLQLWSEGWWIPRSSQDRLVRAANAIDSSEDKPAGCDRQRSGHIPKNNMCSVWLVRFMKIVTMMMKHYQFFLCTQYFFVTFGSGERNSHTGDCCWCRDCQVQSIERCGAVGMKTVSWEWRWLGPKGLWIRFILLSEVDKGCLVSSSKQSWIHAGCHKDSHEEENIISYHIISYHIYSYLKIFTVDSPCKSDLF